MALMSTISIYVLTVLCMAITKTTFAIPVQEFYPFGAETEDLTLPRNDDGSSEAIVLTIPFPYFDQEHGSIFVNNNGAISFTTSVSQYTPDPFPLLGERELIAPYWADVDTTGTGAVWYRETSDPQLLTRATEQIQTAFISHGSFSPTFLFIATWDHVGYYSNHTDKTNTFQCVMATDGTSSFVIFLYADGEIQWTTGDASGGSGGLGGTQAQVGFNAGDGIRFATVPGSRNDTIINITQTTNVAVPGVWIFQVDKEDIAAGGCTVETKVSLTLAPRAGSVLGGTAVQVAGLCFEETDVISCVFDGEATPGVYISKLLALCVSPAFSFIGKGSFKLIVNSTEGVTRAEGTGEFYSLSYDDGHRVEYVSTNAVFDSESSVTLSWSPTSVAPLLDPNSYTVDINLHCLDEDTGKWAMVSTLTANIPNTGHALVTLPDSAGDRKACSMAIQVVVNDATSTDTHSKRAISGLVKTALKFGLWTAVRHYVVIKPALTALCVAWSSTQQRGLAKQLREAVEPCPPTMAQALADRRFDMENQLISNFFHPGTASCFRQVIINTKDQPCKPGSQCCYDRDDKLLIGPKGGGTIDIASPQGQWECYLEHFIKDVLPAIFCCDGLIDLCQEYYRHRPSRSEEGYVFPVPAVGSGDPHLVSLDGFTFTFNGKGEFILIDTLDASFTLQGRMVDAEDVNGLSVHATVFSAIAAKQNDSDTIQIEVSRRGIRARVNGQTVDFEDVIEQAFRNVVLRDRGNNTLSARFSSGAYLEITADIGIISVLSIRLPRSFHNRTFGLLGNYNGDPGDDLMPRDSDEQLAVNSTLEEVHKQFGITWILNNSTGSYFTYNTGETFEDFYYPDYIPTFNPTFSTPELENQAREVCGEDSFCLYDVATTGRTDIGLSTLIASQDHEQRIAFSVPIHCNPPCANGACVANNTCSCATDFEGLYCTDPVFNECPLNPCENEGTCKLHAGSYLCTCAPGYNGALCQNLTGESTEDQSSDGKNIGPLIGVGAAIGAAIATAVIVIAGVILVYSWRSNRSRQKAHQVSAKADMELKTNK